MKRSYLKTVCLIFWCAVWGMNCTLQEDQETAAKQCSSSGTKTLSDVSGDVAFDFADMAGGSMTFDEKNITVTFQLVSLPAALTFFPSTLNDNLMNYKWAIVFDLDGDSATSSGDPMLIVSAIKYAGMTQVSGDLLSNTRARTAHFISTSSYTFDNDIVASVVGNQLILSAVRASDSGLCAIDAATKVSFSTSFNDGVSNENDFMPDMSGAARVFQ